jgi:hypothetical protein
MLVSDSTQAANRRSSDAQSTRSAVEHRGVRLVVGLGIISGSGGGALGNRSHGFVTFARDR